MSITKIFKILISVPIVIVVSFFFLNIFAFTLSYFRIVGASNMVQQVVMDKNYLTDEDIDNFNKYLGSLKTSYLADIRLVIDTDVQTGGRPKDCLAGNQKDLYDWRAVANREYDAATGKVVNTNTYSITTGSKYTNVRKQYGNIVDVGVVATYKFMNPLLPSDMTVSGRAVKGYKYDGSRDTTYLSNAELATKRANNLGGGVIGVVGTVVGLHYYSDLD